MINLRIRNNVTSINVLIDENTTIRSALEQNEIEYDGCMIMMDGTSIRGGTMDRTFADLGYDGTPGHDKARMTCVTKLDNAR